MHQAILKKFEQQFGKIDLGLERIENFMAKLGNPHHKLPKTIHVAGTNGKGSTIAFLRSILEANGETCHVYTSPHLVKFNERIVLAGKEISDEYLGKVLQKVDSAPHDDLTFFELTTAAAFIAFAETPADYLLLETGLGGRLDATNIVPNKALTIITPVSYDHMEFLGNSLVSIAKEKAGIMRDDVPCVIAPQEKEVENILKPNVEILDLKDLPLAGEHQKINASTAIAAAKILGFTNFDGIKNAKWPARLQKLAERNGFEIWLDGAHNLAGAETLSSFDADYVIMGMLKTKDAESFLKVLKPKKLYTIEIPDEPKTFAANDLAAIAKKLGIDAKPTENLQIALGEIYKQPKGKILICGSLYLAGKVLEKSIF